MKGAAFQDGVEVEALLVVEVETWKREVGELLGVVV